MEEQQSRRRRVTSAQLNAQLDVEDFDSMVMQLLTPNSEFGEVVRAQSDFAMVSLKANWQVGALHDTGDTQEAVRATPNDPGAQNLRAA